MRSGHWGKHSPPGSVSSLHESEAAYLESQSEKDICAEGRQGEKGMERALAAAFGPAVSTVSITCAGTCPFLA